MQRGTSYPDPGDFPTLFKTEFRFLTFNSNIIKRDCKNFAVYRPREVILFKTKIDKSIL